MVEHALLDVVLSRCDAVVYAGMVEAEEFAHSGIANLFQVIFIAQVHNSKTSVYNLLLSALV